MTGRTAEPVPTAEQVWVPRRLRLVCRCSAVGVVVIVLGVTTALRLGASANAFGIGDQISLVVLGVLIAGGLLYAGRPRVAADPGGVVVRNMLGTRTVPWSAVIAVHYDEHSSWPVLELAADEMITLLGIPRSEGPSTDRAVADLRRLHARARSTSAR
jgi:hypothetical protein